MPKRKVTSDMPEAPKNKVQKIEGKSEEALLTELNELLTAIGKEYVEKEVKFVIDCKDLKELSAIKLAKQNMDDYGFIILKNAISEASIQKALKDTGNCICETWKETLKGHPNTIKLLKSGQLSAFNEFRNSANGCGNAGFAYFFKQFPEKQHYPTLKIGGKTVYFDINPFYNKVNVELLCHPDNLHSTFLLLALTHVQGFVSWDSVKYTNLPKPKPKTMTKSGMTEMHIDHYRDNTERYQAIDNNDGLIKLFFVPGSSDPRVQSIIAKLARNPNFYSQYGFKSVHNISPALREVFIKHAVAPPKRSRIIWKSGVVHFEGRAKPALLNHPVFPGCCPCQSVSEEPNQTRLRFLVGTQLGPNLSTDALLQLAIAANRGLCPAIYNNINDSTPVGLNTVNKKSTQWKVPRQVSQEESTDLQNRIANIPATASKANEQVHLDLVELLNTEQPSSLKRHLLGAAQDLNSLPFAEEERQILLELAGGPQLIIEQPDLNEKEENSE